MPLHLPLPSSFSYISLLSLSLPLLYPLLLQLLPEVVLPPALLLLYPLALLRLRLAALLLP